MAEPEDTIEILQAGAGALGFALNPDALARFALYARLLREWSGRMNLLGPAALRELWRRHLLDAITVLPGFPPGTIDDQQPRAVIDVGSGGGIPGIPLAILFPHWNVTLLEATGKKARFLETAAGELGLPGLRVVGGRAEEIAHDSEYREAYDFCVARAVTHAAALVELTLPFVAIRGAVYLYKGLNGLSEEIAAAEPARVILGAASPTVLPITAIPDAARCLVRYVKSTRTPRQLPRRPGLPEQRPLTAAEGARIRAEEEAARTRRR
ncbi:MAG TPA: 16S rRNA (guanine(527)-N(7))-methyltransferase RsmG [Chloroflexota bacterium]|nr:16S rRNA (guanine(527)-N(7))-methyltransferase RsmG [Chloroflexota bacterium]